MKRKFAAFDIDGTIGRSSLLLDIVHELIEQKCLKDDQEKQLLLKLNEYKNRSHEKAFEEYSKLSVQILFDNIEKLSVEDYRKAVDSVITRSKSHVHVYTRNMIKKLKNEGYFLIALSGSEMYTVQEFTKQFDFDIAVGEYYHTKNGKFTGKIDEVFHKKNIFIEKFVKEHELTYKDSFAIGDSMGDLGMLDIVENPIAFNPENRLYEHAKKKGWRIVVERKNVIYEMENVDGKYILA